jgi:hypothetical protein
VPKHRRTGKRKGLRVTHHSNYSQSKQQGHDYHLEEEDLVCLLGILQCCVHSDKYLAAHQQPVAWQGKLSIPTSLLRMSAHLF